MQKMQKGGWVMNENQDLLDLCRLNQMEDNIKESIHPEAELTLRLIERKKREKAAKVIDGAPKLSQEQIDQKEKWDAENLKLNDEMTRDE